MKIQIKGGHIIDPANQLDAIQDLFLDNGLIAAIGKQPSGFVADQVIDASGQIVIPGLIDLQARLREPGQEHKGNIDSETRAAASGGITTLCCPPDTSPIIDTPAVAKLIKERAAQANCVNVLPIGALTAELKGEQLSEMHTLHEVGCVAFSNSDAPIGNTLVLRRAMEYAVSHGLTLFMHANDKYLARGGVAHEGPVGLRLGLAGIPESAETVEVARILALVEQTGARVHFGQLSSARAVEMLQQARLRGMSVSADVSAHQLHLTEMDLLDYNSYCHVLPPLRSQRDRDALRSGLKNGTISAICSDHQPHDVDAKQAPFADTEAGISSVETLLALSLRLVDDGVLGMHEMVAALSHGPAQVLGINAGHLGIGGHADICIFDPQAHWSLQEDNIQSQGKNTPFLGWDFKGQVTHTLRAGKLSYQKPESGR